ncbi:MAG: hypothetical protein NC336_06810 [Clostridium sp.]|nr:hypothetical protein [Clostridium sp.]
MPTKKKAPHTEPNWQGYTLDELRYQRALTAARLEIQKERLMNQTQTLRGTFGALQPKGVVGKMLRSLDVIDYGILAFRTVSRITSLLRHARRK